MGAAEISDSSRPGLSHQPHTHAGPAVPLRMPGASTSKTLSHYFVASLLLELEITCIVLVCGILSNVECVFVWRTPGRGASRGGEGGCAPPQPPARLSQPGPRVVGWSGVWEGGRLAQYRTLSPPTRPPPPPLPVPPPLAATQLRPCVILFRSACGWVDPTLRGGRHEPDLLIALPQAFFSLFCLSSLEGRAEP